jgi:acyl-CoA reductase-like NAD-dependent aldehyde dehydrogenase
MTRITGSSQASGRATPLLRVALRIDAGQVMVNGGRTGIETPFGGSKLSGLRREKGYAAATEIMAVEGRVETAEHPARRRGRA